MIPAFTASTPDSDFALRGAHVLPLDKVVGLHVRDETVQDSRVIEGLEMDIVSHELRKFFGLLLKKNGYLLEQLFSPLIVHATPEHTELKAIAPGCVTKHHSHYQELEHQRLRGDLQASHDASRLPELPSKETQRASNDLLVRVRLATHLGA